MLIHIKFFYPFESIKNSIKIVFSSYFYILEEKVGDILSCTCISKNVFKCILKHAFFNVMQWSQRTSSYWSLD
jgi:hypothetical protein